MYGNQSYSQVFEKINDSHEEIVYDLFVITKENYFSHAQTAVEEEEAI